MFGCFFAVKRPGSASHFLSKVTLWVMGARRVEIASHISKELKKKTASVGEVMANLEPSYIAYIAGGNVKSFI